MNYYPWEVALEWPKFHLKMEWDPEFQQVINPINRWFKEAGIDLQWEKRGEGPPIEIKGMNYQYSMASRQPLEIVYMFHEKREAIWFKLVWG